MNDQEKIDFLRSALAARDKQIDSMKLDLARKEPLLKQMDLYAGDVAKALDETLQLKLKQEYVINKLLERINSLERRLIISEAEKDEFLDERQRDILSERAKAH